MTQSMFRIFAVCGLLGACRGDHELPASRNGSATASMINVSAAEVLVRRFIAFDTLSHRDSALALIQAARCDVMPSTDNLRPTYSVDIQGPELDGDTAVFTVTYRTLGVSTGEAPEGATPAQVSFKDTVDADTEIFKVFQDQSGALWIDCDYHPANHPGVKVFSGQARFMPDDAKKRWDAASGALNKQ